MRASKFEELNDHVKAQLLRIVLCENRHTWKHKIPSFKRSSYSGHGTCRYKFPRVAIKNAPGSRSSGNRRLRSQHFSSQKALK